MVISAINSAGILRYLYTYTTVANAVFCTKGHSYVGFFFLGKKIKIIISNDLVTSELSSQISFYDFANSSMLLGLSGILVPLSA